MEFLVGRIFVDPTLQDFSPKKKNAWYFFLLFYFKRSLLKKIQKKKKKKNDSYLSAVETLARLHQINYESIGLIDYGKSGGFYTRQISRMSTTSRLLLIIYFIFFFFYLKQKTSF